MSTSSEVSYWAAQLLKLKGAVIEGGVIDDSEESDVFLGLKIRLPDKTTRVVWLLSDEEGNGPGRFEITQEK